MPNWKLKAYIQKVISRLPNSYSWNYFFQKYITKGLVLTDELFEDKLSHARDHLSYLKTYHQKPINEIIILELGTGWMPIVPIAYFLAGANQVLTVDLNNLLRKKEIQQVIQIFLKYHSKGLLSEFIPVNPDRLTLLSQIALKNHNDIHELLEDLHIRSYVADARDLDIPSNSIDQIISNNVLEHIPESIIAGIFKNFHQLLSQNGIMTHFIDLTDHFAHFDQTISIFHFLKYSEKHWDQYNNNVLFLNRLRFPDYEKLLIETGFTIIKDEKLHANKTSITSVDIHPDFHHLSEEEILISHCWFICKK